MLTFQRAYARLRGVSPAYICQLVKRGTITLVAGKIDTKLADRQFAATDNARRCKLRLKLNVVSLADVRDKKPLTYNTMREAYRAQPAKLDYEERINKLVSAEQLRREALEAGRRVREAFMVLLERISAILAGQEEAVIRTRLREERRQILQTLSGGGESWTA